ncbi:NERD domain-containing protein [Sediminibacillus albus]|uniref:Nuclease-related domain-containing protein n=1 Tax=Sediminibacillus albus TaxID=407036 RepID=A0A1G9BYT7_9BACI|nr:NERD domain-containing protein [Sediminibacillus albus]SDK44587.1 hypothetical protein SAMN05216243_3208 [Sediminibacillus albus]
MAQLIKLQNYISRYERNIFHYPGQFSRLKKENWQKAVTQWEDQQPSSHQNKEEDYSAEQPLAKWRTVFKRKQKEEAFETEEEKSTIPLTKEELKQRFLDHLFSFQLKWASTTVSRMSFIDRDFYYDQTLKYFLQRFPDTNLLMYRPVFYLKNSEIEGDHIIIHPHGIEIIKLAEKKSAVKITAEDERLWLVDENKTPVRFLSPMVSLKRTEQVIRSILDLYNIDFPINKIVLSRTNPIEYEREPYLTRFVDSTNHDKWLEEKRNAVSPLKHGQLKACSALLKHCQTISVKRREWEEDDGLDTSQL